LLPIVGSGKRDEAKDAKRPKTPAAKTTPTTRSTGTGRKAG
jgi:hypothetical protein